LLRIKSKKYGEQIIYTDFRSSSVSALGDINQVVHIAGWEGNDLIIETTNSDGKRLIQSLKLLSHPHRLQRITELLISNNKSKSVKLKQIYKLKNK